MKFDEMVKAVRDQVSERDARRDALAARILAILDSAMGACGTDRVEVAGFRVARAEVHATCSQWGDGSYPTTGRETALLVDGEFSFGVLDLGFWDGRNHQHQRGPAMNGSTRIRPCPVQALRAIADELPEVTAKMLGARLTKASSEAQDAAEALARLT